MKSTPLKMSYMCKQSGVPLCRQIHVNNRALFSSIVKFCSDQNIKCSATVILELSVLIALFYGENYCSTCPALQVGFPVQMKTTTIIAIVLK